MPAAAAASDFAPLQTLRVRHDNYGQQFGFPLAYHATADQQSWQALEKFLVEVFKEDDQ